MYRTYLMLVLVVLFTGIGSAQPTCNDIHVVGVAAVDPSGAPEVFFDKMAGDSICVYMELIEIGEGGYPPYFFDVLIEIKDPDGITKGSCCLDDIGLSVINYPEIFSPPWFLCCYALQPDDPVGMYTINVTIYDNPGSCETQCIPGSWNQAEVSVTGVVPVELLRFEAISETGRVEIRWETSSEADNLGFYVLRSNEAEGQYRRISDLIEARGAPSTGAVYTFADKPDTGIYYYRLEDVGTDGSSTIHDPARVVVGNVETWGAIKSKFAE